MDISSPQIAPTPNHHQDHFSCKEQVKPDWSKLNDAWKACFVKQGALQIRVLESSCATLVKISKQVRVIFTVTCTVKATNVLMQHLNTAQISRSIKGLSCCVALLAFIDCWFMNNMHQKFYHLKLNFNNSLIWLASWPTQFLWTHSTNTRRICWLVCGNEFFFWCPLSSDHICSITSMESALPLALLSEMLDFLSKRQMNF